MPRKKSYLIPLSTEPTLRPPRVAGERDYSIPRDLWEVDQAAGSLLHWAASPSRVGPGHGVDWVQPFEFTATLRLEEGVTSGRSAKYVHWREEITNKVYPMFISEFVSLVRNGTIAQGRASGRWGFRKRGQNFGIEFVRPYERSL